MYKDKNIFFVGYYSLDKEKNIFPSAISKIDYIIGVINDLGYSVKIISPSRLTRKSGKKTKKSKTTIGKNVLYECSSIPEKNAIWKYFQILYSHIWVFLFLIFKVKKGKKVFSYHILGLDPIVIFASKIKKFKVILEVGEIFNDVESNKLTRRDKEINNIRKADYFMYSTNLLNPICNPTNKRNITALGSYRVRPVVEMINYDSTFRIVYAGILRKDKGVDLAIEIAKFLDSSYKIHIIGYGEEDDVKRVKDKIFSSNKKYSCKVSYDGLLYGYEYDKLLQSCSVGLCTQSSEVNYNATAFPSKVISYLSNGLPVIAIRIKSIEESAVSKLVHFYENNSNAAMQISSIIRNNSFIKSSQIRQELIKLHEEFKLNLEDLINE
jgi:glycosyltransferase involved in cell wall biosynthesis